MSVVINTVLDELNALRLGSKDISVILDKSSSYSQFEYFIEYYFLFQGFKSTTLDVINIKSIREIILIITKL